MRAVVLRGPRVRFTKDKRPKVAFQRQKREMHNGSITFRNLALSHVFRIHHKDGFEPIRQKTRFSSSQKPITLFLVPLCRNDARQFLRFFEHFLRTFGKHFFELRAPKMQLAVRSEFLEIGTGRYSFYPTFFQNLTPRTATVHSNADNPKSPNLLLF